MMLRPTCPRPRGVAVQGPAYGLRADSFDLSFVDGTFTFEGDTQTVVEAQSDRVLGDGSSWLSPRPRPPRRTGARSAMLGNVPLNNPVEISAKLITPASAARPPSPGRPGQALHADLKCDKMVAYYTGAREVTRVECTGGVKAQDGDRFARGERAEYDVPSGVLVVTGSPEARQGTTYVTGTKVRLTLGSERLEVENARIVVETAPASGGKKGKGGVKKP